ncbi:bifunctional folylpolyglutamate synthase/dihydrofolate synthase [Anoxybacter fermentans]|nr:folylpolyglutamate synthase/dihydrofolate synthase family protein [Anoxybacter fermentans]
MNYMDYINSFSKFKMGGGYRPGLERVKAALKELGNPEREVKIIHVAGTNGKGSTSAMMASILKQAGYRVGFYSSPHLHHFRERFRINGVPISKEELELMVKKVKPVIEEISKDPKLGRPSFFEVVTVIAFVYFAYKKVDALVLEVGLGGRLDATNVVYPLISVITSIGHDHTEYLGTTLSEIAFEKAGIIKENVAVVTGVQDKEAFATIEKVAKDKNAPLYAPLREAEWTKKEENLIKQKIDLTLESQFYHDLEIGLLGEHQIRNAIVALKTILLLKEHFPAVDEQAIRRGFKEVKWPGRLELIRENPSVLLDGAHNIEGIEALALFLERVKNNFDHLYLVMSILKDKDVDPMVRRIAPLASGIIFTQNHNLRASSGEDLARILEGEEVDIKVIPDFATAIHKAIIEAKSSDLVCITGSLYTIAEAREILLPGDQGIL